MYVGVFACVLASMCAQKHMNVGRFVRIPEIGSECLLPSVPCTLETESSVNSALAGSARAVSGILVSAF